MLTNQQSTKIFSTNRDTKRKLLEKNARAEKWPANVLYLISVFCELVWFSCFSPFNFFKQQLTYNFRRVEITVLQFDTVRNCSL